MQRFETLFTEKKFTEFITDYKSIENKILDKDKGRLYPMLALAYFHTEQYDESSKLHAFMCESSTDINLWFNLSTSAILNGEYERGDAALDQAMTFYQELDDEAKGKIIPIPFMLVYTIQALKDKEQYDLAFERLHQLASIYIQVKITDTHFLYVRGIPSFDNFLELATNILPLQKVANITEWLSTLASHIDDEGGAKLEEVRKQIV